MSGARDVPSARGPFTTLLGFPTRKAPSSVPDPSSGSESSNPDSSPNVVIIGAGPAGLTAAYELVTRYGDHRRRSSRPTRSSGGISRTVERDGWRFDIGGHRFFTKVKEVEDALARDPARRGLHDAAAHEPHLLRGQVLRLPAQGLQRAAQPRHPRGDPLRAVVPRGSGSIHRRTRSTLEGWIVGRFGWRLYRHFFKTYNEKLWGVPVNKLPADFAAQRIKNLSFINAVTTALMPKRNQKDITSLIEEFQYPKFGPGMMWERCRDLVEARAARSS